MTTGNALFVTHNLNSQKHWSAVFEETDIKVVYASALSVTLAKFGDMDIDLFLVEFSGNLESDAERIKRLRLQFDQPILLIAHGATDEYAIAAYRAGVDECIYGRFSSDFLVTKIDTWLRWLNRPKQMPQRQRVLHNLSTNGSAIFRSV